MKSNSKVECWLDDVANRCHEFAIETNLDFYIFQTPIFNNPDLLIIGINPGGEKTYSQVLKEKKINRRTPETILYRENTLIEKPKWEIDNKLKGSDVLRDRMSRIFNEKNNLNLLGHSMMMNMFYFNTQREIDISKINIKDTIKKFCIEKTIEFIDIIKPKNILFLTTNDKNLKDMNVTNIEIIGNNIKKGVLQNNVIYAIPHYGYYSAYSYENSEKTGKFLSQLFKK